MNDNIVIASVTVLIIIFALALMYFSYRLLAWSLKSRPSVHKS